MKLADKVCVVTGAASGIGKALAARFAAEGARAVVGADLRTDPDNGVACDVSNEEDIRRLTETVIAKHGRIDLFCSNAGIIERAGLDAPLDAWRRTMDVNFMAHLYAARAVIPRARRSATRDAYRSGSGTWTATRLTSPPTDKQCVASTADAWCVYFPANNQFWVESSFNDLNGVVASATLTGYKIDTPIPYAYNLYPDRPKEWWTNPNVYISTGTAPVFPLRYTATIVFKDGTTQVISGDVTKWEYAQ